MGGANWKLEGRGEALWEEAGRNCGMGLEAEHGLKAGQCPWGRSLRDGVSGGRREGTGRTHLVHQALRIEQRGAGDGVHLQRVASVGKQELRAR